jgi:hypothetical protein
MFLSATRSKSQGFPETQQCTRSPLETLCNRTNCSSHLCETFPSVAPPPPLSRSTAAAPSATPSCQGSDQAQPQPVNLQLTFS